MGAGLGLIFVFESDLRFGTGGFGRGSIFFSIGGGSIDDEGNWEQDYTLDAGQPDGLWFISRITLEDKAGNQSDIYYSSAGSSILSFEVPNSLYLGSSLLISFNKDFLRNSSNIQIVNI